MGNSKSRSQEEYTHDGKDFTRLSVAKKFELSPAESSQQEDDGSVTLMPIVRGRLDPQLLAKFLALPLFHTPTTTSTTNANEKEEEDPSSSVERDSPSAMKKTKTGEPSQEEMEELGFTTCKDPGHPFEHVYYEGYFHGKGTNIPVKSLNPRYGNDHMKPPAPKEFQAFLAALRKVNAPALKLLLARSGFSCAVPEDCLFCDIAVQSHHGAGVEISEHSFEGWHFDAPNSLLHMAVSLHGSRVLHFRGSGGNYHQAKMQTGDVYITSPYSFEHAVEYPTCTWDNRVLAAQVRILFSEERYEHLMIAKKEKKDFLPNATKVVAELLLQLEEDPTCFRLPSLQEVDESFHELSVDDEKDESGAAVDGPTRQNPDDE